MLHGTGFCLEGGDNEPVRGFYRNVYVLAENAASAIERAKKIEIGTLHKGEFAAVLSDVTERDLAVEEVEESWAYWKLLRPEGHIFYSSDDETEADSGRPAQGLS
jgi:hypothetical protein